MNKRKMLIVGVGSLLLVGIGVAAIPFVASMRPSASLFQPTAEVQLDKLAAGAFKKFEWLGRPVLIVRPTSEMVEELRRNTDNTWNRRSLVGTDVFVFYSSSPVHGCSVQHAPPGPRYPGDDKWPGGFFDPCHYGAWDYAGRALRLDDGSPQPEDLESPKFELSGDVIHFYL